MAAKDDPSDIAPRTAISVKKLETAKAAPAAKDVLIKLRRFTAR